jgi:hypothetical protein
MQTDPHRTDAPEYRTTRNGGLGRAIAIIAVIAVVALALAWVLGLFNVDTSGRLVAPEVTVEGGEVPNVDVETADIDVGTETTTIEVPTVDIDRPNDDGVAKD